MRDSTVWDFKMWPMAVLTGNPINGRFFIMKCMVDGFAGSKKLAVITRWP